MKVVRTFATSANLGPGFDTFGLCYEFYNEYAFEVSLFYILEGFDSKYSDPSKNLIIQSYEEVFKTLNKDIIPLKITQLVQNIPTSRGLGSSASCIVAGVLMANDILENILTKDEIFQIASKIEGHPDNVAPLIFGGFTCSFKNEKYHTIELSIASDFVFTLCIPNFELETAVARSVLPKEVKMADAVSNISHSVALVKAFETNDLELLKIASVDKLHQDYRFPLIKDSNYFINFAKENNAVCMISGAGPTILLISHEKLHIEKEDWLIKELYLSDQGAFVYEK